MRIYKIVLFLLPFFSFSQNEFTVYFDFNADFPNQESVVQFEKWHLDKVVEVTKIEGFCDSIDTKNYNKELAERRVKSIYELLKKNKVTVNEDVKLISYGKEFQLSENQDKNRKVVITYSIKEKQQPETIVTSSAVEKHNSELSLTARIKEEKSSLRGKFAKAKVGDFIRINNIHFEFNSEKIIPESYPILEELYMILVENPKMVIKINGNICCNPNTADTKLSFRRALKIFNFLKSRGIPTNRLAYHGFGSGNPIYPIPEKNEEERIANRRVEILIVENKK